MLNIVVSLVLAAGLGGQVGSIPDAPRVQAPPRDPTHKPVVGKGSISGRVLTADTGVPIRRAAVTASGSSGRRMVYTDQDGRFSLTDLPPGSYMLSASPGNHRAQYLAHFYGAAAAMTRPRTIDLADGQQVPDINLALQRASAISGHVTDDTGQPLARAHVAALLLRRGAEPMPVGGAQTDDHGRFRLFGLQPGEYLVVASTNNSGTPPEVQADLLGFERSYAPGTVSVEQAQRITLRHGVEATADVRLAETRLFRITGTVVDSSGQPLQSPSISVSPAGSPIGTGGTVSTRSAGQFTAYNLPAGRYDITVGHYPGRGRSPEGVSASPPVQSNRFEQAFLTVDVAGDVDGVVLMTQPGATVTGEIVFEDLNPGRRARLFTLGLERRGTMMSAQVEVADTSFTLTNVFAPLLLRGSVSAIGWGLKAVLLHGRDITDDPTLFTAKDSGHLQVVFTGRAPAVEAVVTGEGGKPATEGVVVLFGQDERTWLSRLSMTRTGRIGKDGKVTIGALREGNYFAAAVTPETLRNGVPDRELLAELSKVATRVTVNAGETRSIDLKIWTGAAPQAVAGAVASSSGSDTTASTVRFLPSRFAR